MKTIQVQTLRKGETQYSEVKTMDASDVIRKLEALECMGGKFYMKVFHLGDKFHPGDKSASYWSDESEYLNYNYSTKRRSVRKKTSRTIKDLLSKDKVKALIQFKG